MFKKQPNGFVISTTLPFLHAFTTRGLGDMKKSKENRTKAMRELFGEERELMFGKQLHTNVVGIDAVVTNKPHAAVGVFVADCVPILLADIKKRVIGAVHAGWRGTLGGITTNAIREMNSYGSQPGNIIAVIGPHIGMCHYDVPEERAKKFLAAFGDDRKVASFFEGSWHVDLGWANYRQLLAQGITQEHIDAPPTCTACQIDTYFSYRKDSKETFGEIMGVVGL